MNIDVFIQILPAELLDAARSDGEQHPTVQIVVDSEQVLDILLSAYTATGA